ncbi:CDP-alcohol phosphatidyltransferase family protein [Kineococcus rubinsiae]|uniref:CDP-alcohol phosphatidyltransferase family protein n=1 Tax=Kineococcus rubinsiae TaxID=2609562 RepID=UPI001431BCA8|nr:CDP-alcohol phosphatidyltransferase family protein [Kineococcus rubinsiae]NIZ92919.1 CDP-alcohol phosphatidyltransferase [Kineococcus rubinsiae]
MNRDTYLQRWSALHGGAAPTPIVRGWLTGVHAVAAPLAALRVPPAAVTLAGAVGSVVAGVLAVRAGPGGAGAVLAAAVLTVSGLLDNLDGAVAVISDRVGRRGALLDAACDRLGDAACAVVLWGCGAPAWLALLAGGLAQWQEYVRARGQGLGVTEVGVVTVAERPTRISIAAATAAATAIVPEVGWATIGTAVWAALGVVGFVQLWIALSRRLG